LDLIPSNAIALLALIVLALTLCFVIKYTMITANLRRTAEQQTNELIKQRRLPSMPSLIHSVKFMPRDSDKGLLHVTYIGNGAAVNVFTENFFLLMALKPILSLIQSN